MRNNFVLPLLMGVAFLVLGAALPALKPDSEDVWKYGSLAVGVLLLIVSYFVASNSKLSATQARGGKGGSASAPGEDADAVGGAGGNANGGQGGDGGNARATGKGARAKGGAGGSG